jgi:hypothetical protein
VSSASASPFLARSSKSSDASLARDSVNPTLPNGWQHA